MTLPILVSGATGKMGKAVQEIIQEQPQKYSFTKAISLRPSRDTINPLTYAEAEASHNLASSVIVDFSRPQLCLAILKNKALENLPLVTGTTGFSSDQMQFLEESAKSRPILFSANMSLGINLMLGLLEQATHKLAEVECDIEISETHHKHKQDAPSGTALLLAERIAQAKGMTRDQLLSPPYAGSNQARTPGKVGMSVQRLGAVIGEHTVSFGFGQEIMSIKHSSRNRSIYAEGALQAAGWLFKQPAGRLYSLSDVLG